MDVEELLRLWRTARDPALGQRIVEIAPQAPLVTAFEAEKKGGMGGALARMEAFDAPGDPRVGRFLLMLLERYRPWDSPKATKIHARAFELLPRHADVAIVAELAKLAETPQRTGRMVTTPWFETAVRVALAELRRVVPEPTATDHAGLSPAASPPAVDRRAALYAAVYAAPDEDGPRAVLSDYLLERGEPHGELIAAQLSGNEKRARTLLKTPGRFADPRVWRALFQRSVTFERGFVASGTLHPRSAADFDLAIGAEAWATVHTLQLSYFAGWGSTPDETTKTLALLTHPAMRHLKHVGPIGYSEVIALVRHGKPLPWRTVPIERRTNDATDEEFEAVKPHIGRIFPNRTGP